MGWLDNLWRRRQGDATDQQIDASAESETGVADELEEEAHDARDEQAFEEPRPPGG